MTTASCTKRPQLQRIPAQSDAKKSCLQEAQTQIGSGTPDRASRCIFHPHGWDLLSLGMAGDPSLCSAHLNDHTTEENHIYMAGYGWEIKHFHFSSRRQENQKFSLHFFKIKNRHSLFIFEQMATTPTWERTCTAFCSWIKVKLKGWNNTWNNTIHYYYLLFIKYCRTKKTSGSSESPRFGARTEEREGKICFYKSFQELSIWTPQYHNHSASSTSTRMLSGCPASKSSKQFIWTTHEYTSSIS